MPDSSRTGRLFTCRLSDFATVTELASAACRVKVKEPGVVGIPETLQIEPSIDTQEEVYLQLGAGVWQSTARHYNGAS